MEMFKDLKKWFCNVEKFVDVCGIENYKVVVEILVDFWEVVGGDEGEWIIWSHVVCFV